MKRSLNLVENIIGAPMKKNHWFLIIHLFYFGFAYSAWNDGLSTEIAYEYPDAGGFIEVTYTHITNADEFNLFVQAAKNAIEVDRTTLNANIILKNDIDLGYYFDGEVCRSKLDSSIASFESIAPFNGSFNGNSYKISGLCIQQEKTDIIDDKVTPSTVGLFSSQIKKIENLKIENAYVQGDVAGVVIGEGSDSTIIINSHVYNSTVIGTSAVGGLAGRQVLSIEKSSVNDTKLQLESDINESGDIGGLIGRLDASYEYKILIQESFVKNTSINSILPIQNVGGLIGSIQSEIEITDPVSILNSFVETNISTVNQVNIGGLIGYFSLPYASVLITSSYFKGDIISSKADDELSCFGGFVGSATNVSIDQSYQKGSIQTKAGLSVGGFIGQVTGNSITQISQSYQNGSIQANSSYQGLFIGSSLTSDYSITSVYSVPDSSSNLEVVGTYNPGVTDFFDGFIADKNGGNSLDGKTKVKPSLLQNRSAAYLLNKKVSRTVAAPPLLWTQNPNLNDGYPYIRPDYYYPIYQVVLIDTASVPDTVYNSPLTGKLDESVFKKYPLLGGVGQDKYSFEEFIDEIYSGNSLTPQTIITENKTFFLSKTNRYAIKYNLNTDEFVFWLNDSITDYPETYNNLKLPIVIKDSSCFLGWNASKKENDTSVDQQTEIYFNDFNGSDPYSTIYLTAQWSNDLEKCTGWKAEYNNYISVYAFHGLVTISNNGNPLSPSSTWGYTIPSVTHSDYGEYPIPLRIDVTPKKGFELDSLYFKSHQNTYTSFFIPGSNLSFSSTAEIHAVFKSITGESNPLYTITYDIPFEPLNDSTPTLFLTEDYITTYNDQGPHNLPELVKAHECFSYWNIQCSTKGTCSQAGFLTDVPIGEEDNAESHYFPENFEGDVTLKPVFGECNPKEEEAQTIIQVNLKQNENGRLSLWNNQREVLSGVGTIKIPKRFDMVPPLQIKAIPDSSYEFKEIYLQYFDNDFFQPSGSKTAESNIAAPFSFENNVSISALFNKMTLAFRSHSFKQKGGAFLYEGSLDRIVAESNVSASLIVKNKNGTYKDSLLFDSLKAKDTFSMKKICLPLEEFDFTVSLKAANTIISKSFNFAVDSLLQFKPSSWHMISLANLSSKFEKTRDEIFFAWNDSAALGDYWQYQELHSMDEKNPSQGYWFQSLSDNSLPLQVNTSSCVNPETQISWELISGQTGWNLIANPYHWPISLNIAEGDDSTAFWKWNDALGAYDRVYHLEANSAAWVQVSKNKTWETTANPFFSSEETVVAKNRIHQAKALRSNDWKIQLKLKNTLGKEDAYNFIGVSAKASSIEEPPQGMGSFVNLSILNKNKKLAENIISSESSVWSWDILLTSSGNKDAFLELEGIKALIAMGYKVAINIDGSLMELKEGSSIPVEIKEEGSKATITVMPAQDFDLAQKINGLTYYKQGTAWKIAFDAGLALDRSKAVVSLHNIKGKRISGTAAEVNLGSNELILNGADFAGVVIINITIYSESGAILYQHNQKLLEKR